MEKGKSETENNDEIIVIEMRRSRKHNKKAATRSPTTEKRKAIEEVMSRKRKKIKPQNEENNVQLVTPELYETHLNHSLAIEESIEVQMFHCKTTDCPGCWLYEMDDKEFFCAICQHVNCLSCNMIHEGKTCQEHRSYFESQMQQNVENSSSQFAATEPSTKIKKILMCQTEGCIGSFLCKKDICSFECGLCKQLNFIPGAVVTRKVQSWEEYKSLIKSQPVKDVQKQDEIDQIKKNYERHVKFDDEILVSNSDPFTCPVCFGDIAKDEGVILHECLHCFCRPCLISTVLHSETPTVKCPFINEIYKCDSDLQETEIKSLVSSELYEKHLQRSITIAEGCAEKSFHCKMPNCPGWCFYDDNLLFICCGTCGHTSCRSCDAIHEGKTCEQYQELNRVLLKQSDGKEECLTKTHIDGLIKSEEAMPCPTCKAILHKDGGCDAIVCVICKTEVCWATKGPRWGPKGKGDISGGCRCDFKVKKCHPRCGYCH